MVGECVMGICYVCEKEVTNEEFSQVGYQMYKNVVHAGECFKTFKKQVQEHKAKRKTDQLYYDITEEIKGLRKDLRELIEVVKAKEVYPEESFEWDPEHFMKIKEEYEGKMKPIQALIDAKALELYIKSKGAGENV